MAQIRELDVPLSSGTSVTARLYEAATPGTAGPPGLLVLAHGAGAGHDSPFMVAYAKALADLGVDTATFNFGYTQRGRKVPDQRPALEACYLAVIEQLRRVHPPAQDALFIGGKSMGGRMATHVATDPALGVAGLVLLGYPLHPPGRPEQRRDAHLGAVTAPMLFVQGTRDAFGTPSELAPVLAAIGDRATLHVVAGGDHSFKVARPASQAAIHEQVQRTIVGWIGTTRRP